MKVHFGEGKDYEIREGESILDLARRVGFPLATGCFGGGCGVCKIHLVAGRVHLEGVMSCKRLSEAEKGQGYILACRAIPDTDITIDQYAIFRREKVWLAAVELVSTT